MLVLCSCAGCIVCQPHGFMWVCWRPAAAGRRCWGGAAGGVQPATSHSTAAGSLPPRVLHCNMAWIWQLKCLLRTSLATACRHGTLGRPRPEAADPPGLGHGAGHRSAGTCAWGPIPLTVALNGSKGRGLGLLLLLFYRLLQKNVTAPVYRSQSPRRGWAHGAACGHPRTIHDIGVPNLPWRAPPGGASPTMERVLGASHGGTRAAAATSPPPLQAWKRPSRAHKRSTLGAPVDSRL